ncbi:acryloyl-CoA reductase [Erysipelothrix rhusiopathiae]|nr:acryloyl-CoA reductase [Erysipelothrix rhusiopathiae]
MEYKALVLNSNHDNVIPEIKILNTDDLNHDVLIKVSYASVNYKDGLAMRPKTRVVGEYPTVVGIDFTGTVVESNVEKFHIGDEVIVTSHDILKYRTGGFAEYASVPASEVTLLPESLSLKTAAIIGTAGYTAALSVYRMMQQTNPMKREPVLVLGASGGVGSVACAILDRLGYPVTAVSRKKDTAQDYFKNMNVKEVMHPDELTEEPLKPLGKMMWTAVIDPIGGKYSSYLLPHLNYEGVYLLSGNTAGAKFETTVFPFILRGIQVIGIDSVNNNLKDVLWGLIATDYKPRNIHALCDREITLEDVPQALEDILEGKMMGRTIVKL